MAALIVLAALAFAVAPASALFSPGGPVTLLDPSNFESKLKGRVSIVMFYAPVRRAAGDSAAAARSSGMGTARRAR